MSFNISIERVKRSRISEIDFNNIQFGRNFSDHMFIADYYNGEWRDARIVPFGPMELHPATFALHYGQAIFEGLKAYKSADGNIRIFSPIKTGNASINQHSDGHGRVPRDLFFKALDMLVAY